LLLPSVGAARLSCCPACNAPAIIDGRIILHGHGLRTRALLRQLDRRQLPHHRGFTFVWEQAGTWKMRLDEGFGFLVEGARTDRFPFGSDPAVRASKLLSTRISVDRRLPFPSQFYVQHLPE
jgi:hypothetical protein